MYVRDVSIDPPLALAPMEGVTDLLFRRLIRRIGGCGLTVTEFVSARGLAEKIPQEMRLVRFDPDERPLAIQVYGRDPVAMAEGARIAQDLGADIVDLNMGCPSKKVCKNSGGSSLMREPAVARQIVAAMRAAVSVPLTVKMRSGWDADLKNAPELAQMCEDEGAEAVTVHWRTRADLYGGERELDTLAEVVSRLSIPVLANGDIIDAASARQTLAHTHCAGLMIGRGAVRNPWVFREIEAELAGLPAPSITPTQREELLLGFYADIHEHFDHEKAALGRMKKIAKYFTDGVEHGAILRQQIFHSHSAAEVEARVRAFFDALRTAASRGEPVQIDALTA